MSEPNSKFGHYARTLNEKEVEKLLKDSVLISEFKQNKLEVEAKKNWDLFYKRNKTNFFKDRHWSQREFEELTHTTIENSSKPILLEVGCGVGNFIFPLIADNTKFFIYACDFSPQAVGLVKENKLYNSDACCAFVHDITKEALTNLIAPDFIDICSMIFVLSAINPSKMSFALKNIFQVLKPGGLLLFRDYGLYDQAMLRFAAGHKLGDNFYVRQDGTRAFYFSEEYLTNLVLDVGFKIISVSYITRETVNHKENKCVPRVYIQGKFMKSTNATDENFGNMNKNAT